MSDPDSPMNHDPIPDPIPDPDPNQIQPPPPASVTDLTIASIPPPSKASRRLPPPCWSLEETIALIDAYREKWLALNRGNLKANHWEEVAESVSANCPNVTLKKTAVQCRHKMEKLRKRYRTEIQRARSVPVARFMSSWVHFKRMESMEIRVETKLSKYSEEEEEEEDGNYAARFRGGGSVAARTTTPRFFNRNGSVGSGSSSGGIRIRIPTGVSIAQPGPRFPGKIDQKYTANSSSIPARVSNFGGGKRGREMEEEEAEEDDPMVAIASAIKLLGDTLVRTENTKMEMTKEIEAMRMDMEMKRTKMILESQQRIVEAFAKSLSENAEKKKARRVSSLATSLATDS
ncbi:hypothetical protein AALP_AA4G236000 [Arabis alpina]|uniref:Myb-like domain-containing protein n=1 Tax=Arabis alpina TaxID=50452 RepID=A0A087H573_ARAAL|nr:hypothetical protein AALP_AA4G236000 [Arabis alpina]